MVHSKCISFKGERADVIFFLMRNSKKIFKLGVRYNQQAIIFWGQMERSSILQCVAPQLQLKNTYKFRDFSPKLISLLV